MLRPLPERPLFNSPLFLVLRPHWGCTFQLLLPSVELPRGPIMSFGCATASFFLTLLLAGQLEAARPCGWQSEKPTGSKQALGQSACPALFCPVGVSEGLSLPARNLGPWQPYFYHPTWTQEAAGNWHGSSASSQDLPLSSFLLSHHLSLLLWSSEMQGSCCPPTITS